MTLRAVSWHPADCYLYNFTKQQTQNVAVKLY